MKIVRAEVSAVSIPLKAPFTIAFHTTYDAELMLVKLVTDGPHIGIGVAAPFEEVTGESFAACKHALEHTLPGWIEGRMLEHPDVFCRGAVEQFKGLPAARAAIDSALYDLWGKKLDKPVVELLGRAHDSMPTSMTMGIRTLEDSLAEADEFLGMGYLILKVKGGSDIEHDVALLSRLRELHGDDVVLRSDLNQGYTKDTLRQFIDRTQALKLEMIEQPLPVEAIEEHFAFSEAERLLFAADENACAEADALTLAHPPHPAGIINIKLMKCGGIYSSLRMATIADVAGQPTMWGCMIESVVGLSAALHAAFARPNTRYLDLDGDYDLVHDIATGGICLENGVLRCVDAPGLGISLIE